MPSLYLLIPIALLFVSLATLLYWWAIRSGQYRDLDREADRILYHDLEPAESDAADEKISEVNSDRP